MYEASGRGSAGLRHMEALKRVLFCFGAGCQIFLRLLDVQHAHFAHCLVLLDDIADLHLFAVAAGFVRQRHRDIIIAVRPPRR